MNIAIDIRPLLDKRLTGIGEYTYNLLEALLKTDSQNNYFLFYNSYKKRNIKLPKLYGANFCLCPFSYPNKIFNLLTVLKIIKPDRLIEKKYNTKIDTFFFPNLGFINTDKQCRNIITIHDLSFLIDRSFFSFKRNIWHKIINPKNTILTCDRIISVSENTKQDIITVFKIDEKKITPIYLGINPKYKRISFDNYKLKKIRKKYHLPKNFILYLGTLEPRKNIISLIKAFEKIKSDIFLVIAGSNGWKYKKIYKYYLKSRKKDKIIFTGYVKPHEKIYLYNLARLFIYPSFYEGFGFPPLEAAACGCPVITSLGSSLGEICNDSALIIDP